MLLSPAPSFLSIERTVKTRTAVSATLLDSLALPLGLASLGLGWAARRVFFHFAPALWAQQTPVDLSTVTPWTAGLFDDADGAEPIALLTLVVLASAVISGLAMALSRASRRVRAAMAGLGLLGGLLLLRDAHFVLPLPEASPWSVRTCGLIGVAIVLSGWLGWGQRQGRTLSVATALLFLPLAFLPSSPPSIADAAAILMPALRLLHGAAPAQVYMQYDYLPSLIAEGWLWLGGAPGGIFF